MRTEAEAPRAPEPPSAAGTKRAAKLGSLPGPWQGQPHAGQPPPPRPRLLLPLPPASSLPLSPAPDRPLRECHVAALITNPHRGRSWRGGTPGHVTTSVEDAPAPPAALAPRVAPGSQTLRRAMALSAIQESRPRLVLPSPVQLPHFPSLISNAQKKLQIVILWSI